MTYRLGEGFSPKPVPPDEPAVEYNALLLQQILLAITALQTPAPPAPPTIVQVAEPDLSDIVTAVMGLRPSATAEEIGSAVAAKLNPPTTNTTAVDAILVDLVSKLEQLDFRMKGSMPAFGASGPSNISDNPNRLLGHVTVDGAGAGATEATLAAAKADLDLLVSGAKRVKTHVEFIPNSTAPTTIYKGYASPGTADSVAAWTIQRFVFTSTTADETWTAQGTVKWDDRLTAVFG